jgi:hypothetical protein
MLNRSQLSRLITAGLAAASLATASAALANDDNKTTTLAVFGDSPYGTKPADTAQFEETPHFVASINDDPAVDFVLMVGDIHSGKQYCTEAYDRSIASLWSTFKQPLVYTPGDNEWSDCHKVAQGGGVYNATTGKIDYVLDGAGNPIDYAQGDPIANLDLVRSIFFPKAGHTIGGHKLVASQAMLKDKAHPSDVKYVENVMFLDHDVLVVAVNIPGGSNNDNDVWYGAPAQTPAQVQEVSERTGADLRWLDLAFNVAKELKTRAIVIQTQADMWDPEKGAAHLTAYEPFVKTIAAHTVAYGKPVLMFNGDSHVFLSDNPFDASNPVAAMHPGYTVPNFHRIVVHGSTFPMEWLRVTVSHKGKAPTGPDTFGPFSWTHVLP